MIGTSDKISNIWGVFWTNREQLVLNVVRRKIPGAIKFLVNARSLHCSCLIFLKEGSRIRALQMDNFGSLGRVIECRMLCKESCVECRRGGRED